MAEQLKEQAEAGGAEFEAGYAENSVETQVAQVKRALEEGCSVFYVDLYPQILLLK